MSNIIFFIINLIDSTINIVQKEYNLYFKYSRANNVRHYFYCKNR